MIPVRRKHHFLVALPLALCAGLLAGCGDEHSAEELGESIDESVEDAGDALEDSADDLEDAAREGAEEVEEGLREGAERIDEATEGT